MLSNKTYNVLKYLTMILLPALAFLYASLSDTWGLPYSEEVVKTLNAIAVFIGALIGISTKKYNSLTDLDHDEEKEE